MSRLIIAANRLPFSICRDENELVVRQSSGGLVSALKSYFEKSNDAGFSERIWVGSVDASNEDWKEAEEKNLLSVGYGISPVFPGKEDYDHYYNGFSNSTLWPLFHYFSMLVDYNKDFFNAYVRVNQQFADALIATYEPGDLIWVHDYQLLLLPGMLREKLPDATIGFFMHIPFPSYEIFRMLPGAWKQSLLKGMLGADLIGFHTHDYVQHFMQSAKMILQLDTQFNTIQYETRMIRADLFPISIDYTRFRDAIFNDTVAHISTRLEEKFINQKIIFSVDRLDYTKGLYHRLQGFEEFLVRYPQWREKVVFILNIVPSRDFIQSYVDMRREIEEKVSSINGEFSSLNWQPLIYRYNHLSFEELCALYQSADVALITPLRDGMNLVSKEYIASCLDKGVLILSELAGAASELSEAMLVNPTDVSEVADAIHEALSMPLTEQRNRLSFMQRRIAAYDITKWINDFIEVLMSVKKDQETQQVNILDGPTTMELLNKFKSASRRTLLLDYDGTLTAFQRMPSLAVPGNEVIQILKQLAQNPDTDVVIVSGRDADTLDKWLGQIPLSMVAEHGAQIKFKGEEWQEQVTISTEWKEQVRPLLELYSTRCVGSFIEEKKNTLAWHYRNTHPDLGFNRSRELRNALLQLTANTALQVIDGNKVLEVRQTGIDKGATAQKIYDRFHPDFMLCIGDDTTDEDMFRILRDKAWTIKIGGGGTAAKYTMWSQTQVLPLLKKFILPIGQASYSG
jgi:trehalose 6-phosphate synthase/phosphatase